MDRLFVGERYDAQVSAPQFWHGCPEAEAVEILGFYAERCGHHSYTHFLGQLGPLTQNLIFKVRRKMVVCHTIQV